MRAEAAAGTALRVSIIGAGPRGLSVCERLVALAGDDRRLRIDLFDPYPPGAGRVWRTDQSTELLMNTTIADQTVFPDATTGLTPCDTGPSMPEWYVRRGGTAPTDSTFPSRTLYGEYLEWAFEHVRESAGAGVDIVVHRTAATAIVEPGRAEGLPAVQLVRLADGTAVEADAVVLCVGHIDAQLVGERAGFRRFARAAGLTYLPPGLPAETEVDALQPGETVIFRGFGLNYFDLQALLTSGRGGVFEPAAGDAESADPAPEDATTHADRAVGQGRETAGSPSPLRLVYRPSGEEPVLAPASRRGVPYRCKPITPGHPAADWQLRYFTPAAVAALRAETPARGLLFNDQLWPLILSDIRAAWYSALQRSHPQVFATAPGQLFAALDSIVAHHLQSRGAGSVRADRDSSGQPRAGRKISAAPDWAQVEAEVLTDPTAALDLQALLRPLDDAHFADRSFHDWMLAFLDEELAQAGAGPDRSPAKAVFAALWAARAHLKEIVADGLLDPVSFATEVRGWFEGFASGICDGPPPQRFAELAALARAGMVQFIGPDVHIATTKAGQPAAFIATSPAVPGEVRARALVDAASPANNVRYADDDLLAGMMDRGQLALATLMHEGVERPLSGLLVDGPAHNTVDARGRVHPRRFVLSIQLSADQLGLAIAANPGRRARSLIDAHTIARHILDLSE